MDKNDNVKKIHRLIAYILAFPLAWQAVTGYVLYYRFDAAGKARPWKDLMVQLHNGEFLGHAIHLVGLIYILLIIAFVITGVRLLMTKSEDKA